MYTNPRRIRIIIGFCFATIAILSILMMTLAGWALFVTSITSKPFDWVVPLLVIVIFSIVIVILDTLVKQLNNTKFKMEEIITKESEEKGIDIQYHHIYNENPSDVKLKIFLAYILVSLMTILTLLLIGNMIWEIITGFVLIAFLLRLFILFVVGSLIGFLLKQITILDYSKKEEEE